MADAATFDVAGCREQFQSLNRQLNGTPVVYFDGPGGSQVPRRVVDAVADCLTCHNANDGGAFATSREVERLVAQARQSVADLLGTTDPDLVHFGPNMTTLTFALSRALAKTWGPDDEVIVTRLDHDANVAPWVLAARDAGARVHFVEIDRSNCTLQMEQFEALLNERTVLVAVGIASNAVGTLNPIAEIIEAAHKVGALVFLDAVHAAPHILIDVERWQADFLACSPYKFFGPHLGVLWGRRTLLEELPAYKVRPAPESLPGRWMTGTPSFEAIAGTAAAIDYLADLGRRAAQDTSLNRRAAIAAAFRSVQQYETELSARLLSGLAGRPRWKVWGITSANRLRERVPTFGLTSDQHDSGQLAQALADRGIFAWSGNFYALSLMEALGTQQHGMLRIGLMHYNTRDEVDRLLNVLSDLEHSPR